MTGRRGRGAVLVAALALASSCMPQQGADQGAEPNPLEAPPVDTTRVASAAVAAAWPHRVTLEADLDGDDRNETIHLAADVTLAATGEPLWEDGHRWAAWVGDPARPTLLYAAFVPNGHVEAAVTLESSDGTRHLLVDERTPAQSRALTVAYDGPGRARLVSAAYSTVETWFPDLRNASPRAPRDSAASRP